jgi:hypothetical protein
MAMQPARPTLPRGARILVALVLLAAGIATAALGIHKAGSATEPLAIVAVPAGLAFIFGALLVLAPERWQLPLGALMVSALAAVFDWIAFGPGARQFTMTVGAGGGHASWASGEYAGRAFFGLFALLFDIAAIGLWLRLVRTRRNPGGGESYTPE